MIQSLHDIMYVFMMKKKLCNLVYVGLALGRHLALGIHQNGS